MWIAHSRAPACCKSDFVHFFVVNLPTIIATIPTKKAEYICEIAIYKKKKKQIQVDWNFEAKIFVCL